MVIRELLFGIPQNEGWDTCKRRLKEMGLADEAVRKVHIMAHQGGILAAKGLPAEAVRHLDATNTLAW
eukprot:4527931-Prorocentrum_lima.AAC.1